MTPEYIKLAESDMFMPQHSFGVAMIVKNVAPYLSRALDSVGKFARQIVVVDTGSNDATPQIAAKAGAEVHFRLWNDNFSEARNYALSAIRADWILQLDADEEILLDDLAGDKFASAFDFVANSSIGGATVNIVNDLSDGSRSEHRYTRIFRSSPDIFYAGRAHEQITPSIRALGLEIIDAPITIKHYGYARSDSDRVSRNIRLLEQDLLERPNDAWLMYHLGMALFADKRSERAERLLEVAANSSYLSGEQRELARIRGAQASIAIGNYAEAERKIAFRSNSSTREGLRLYIEGMLHGINQRFAEAVACLTRSIAIESSLVNQDDAKRFVEQFAAMI